MSAGADPGPGGLYLAEVGEQPRTLAALAKRGGDIAAIAAELRKRRDQPIRFVAHGSSDNAASYGVYAFGLLAATAAFRDSISLEVYYGADIDVKGTCIVALSQSGRTPDVVEYVRRVTARGACTVAITNDPSSPLAEVASMVVDLRVGEERAIAATKTYTAQVAALALLAAHLGGAGSQYEEGLGTTATLIERTLTETAGAVGEVALALAGMERMLTLGRGPEYGTARELALKLLETCRIAASALTATDLAHGPVAALGPRFPIWAIASDDAVLPIVEDACARAAANGSPVVACGPSAAAVTAADFVLPVPEPPLPLLEPLLSIVPGQLFAATLASRKGLDPDRPNGISKVTTPP